MLLEPDNKTLTLRIYRGLSEEFVKNIQRFNVGEGVSGRAVAERKQVVLDVSDYPTARLAPVVANEGMHELRTPLNSIIGFSELMKEGMSGEINEKQRQFAGNILTSGNHLLALINDILDLSKVEAGKIEIVVEKLEVIFTIENTFTLIKEKAMKQNVTLDREFDPDLDFIEADPLRFKQILFNLLSNAVKFSKPEGSTVTVVSKKEGDMARFSVSDTGIGIKKEDLGKLFKEFEQISTGISKEYGGTGLGLAISKKLVELHSGRISAESKYGEGSTFTFLLPIKSKKEDK